jgi:hypothetical protein
MKGAMCVCIICRCCHHPLLLFAFVKAFQDSPRALVSAPPHPQPLR